MKRWDETGIIYFTDYERYRNDDGSENENFNKNIHKNKFYFFI